MDAAERRCESLHKPVVEAADVVRCVLWNDHSWRVLHRGWDANGLKVHWETEDEWEPPEDRRMGQEPVDLDRYVSPVAMRKIQELEKERDNALMVVGQLDADVYERTVDSLGRGTDGELVKRIEALERQVENQAVTILELRERLRVETNR